MILLRQILQDEICFPNSGSFRYPTWPIKEFLQFLCVHESGMVVLVLIIMSGSAETAIKVAFQMLQACTAHERKMYLEKQP